MAKALHRLLAFLLVLCLAGNPALASLASSPIQSKPVVIPSVYTQQALTAPAAVFARSAFNKKWTVNLFKWGGATAAATVVVSAGRAFLSLPDFNLTPLETTHLLSGGFALVGLLKMFGPRWSFIPFPGMAMVSISDDYSEDNPGNPRDSLEQQVEEFLDTPFRGLQTFARTEEMQLLQMFQKDPRAFERVTITATLDRIGNRGREWASGNYAVENAPTLVVAFMNHATQVPPGQLESPLPLDRIGTYYRNAWDRLRNQTRDYTMTSFFNIAWRWHWYAYYPGLANKTSKRNAHRTVLRAEIQKIIHFYKTHHPDIFKVRPIVPVAKPPAGWEVLIDAFPSTPRPLRIKNTPPDSVEDLVERLKAVSQVDGDLRDFASPEEVRDIQQIIGKKKMLRRTLGNQELFKHYSHLIVEVEKRAQRWLLGHHDVENAPASVRAFIHYVVNKISHRDDAALRAMPERTTVLQFVAQCVQALQADQLTAKGGIEDHMMAFFNNRLLRKSFFVRATRLIHAARIDDRVDLIQLRRKVYQLVHYYATHFENEIAPRVPPAPVLEAAPMPAPVAAAGLRTVAQLDPFVSHGRHTEALQYLIDLYHLQSEEQPELTPDSLIDLYDELDNLSLEGLWPGKSILDFLGPHHPAHAKVEKLIKLLLQRSRYRGKPLALAAVSSEQTPSLEAKPSEASEQLQKSLAHFFEHPEGARYFATFNEWAYLKNKWLRYGRWDQPYPPPVLEVANNLLHQIQERKAAWRASHNAWENLPIGSAAFVHFVVNYWSTRNAFPNPAYHGQRVKPNDRELFIREAYDPVTRTIKPFWIARYDAAVRGNPANQWIAECVGLDAEALIAPVEQLIRSEAEFKQLQQEVSLLEEADHIADDTLPFEGIAQSTLDLLAEITYGMEGARERARARLQEGTDLSLPVINQFLNRFESPPRVRPVQRLDDLTRIVGAPLTFQLEKIILALGLDPAARRHLQENLADPHVRFNLRDWELMAYLLEAGYRDLADLQRLVPKLFSYSHYKTMAPAVELARRIEASSDPQNAILAAILARDLATLQLITEASSGPLSLDALLREYAALTEPAPTIEKVTDIELDQFKSRFEQIRALSERAGKVLEKQNAKEAEQTYSSALLMVQKLLDDLEPVLNRALSSKDDLNDDWFDLHLHASNMRDSLKALRDHAAVLASTPVQPVEESVEEVTPDSLGLDPAIFHESRAGFFANGYRVYILTEKNHVNLLDLRMRQRAFLKKLGFFSQEVNSPRFLQRNPANRPFDLRHIRRIAGINPGNYRFYARVYINGEKSIVILTFDTTGDLKGDGSELTDDLLAHLDAANRALTLDDLRAKYHVVEFIPFRKEKTNGKSGSALGDLGSLKMFALGTLGMPFEPGSWVHWFGIGLMMVGSLEMAMTLWNALFARRENNLPTVLPTGRLRLFIQAA